MRRPAALFIRCHMSASRVSLFAVLAVSLALCPPAGAQTPLAKVGGRVITLEEVRRTVSSMPLGDPRAGLDDYRKNALFLETLNGIIDAELLFIEARRTGVTETDVFRRKADAFGKSTLADEYRKRLLKKTASGEDKGGGGAAKAALAADRARLRQRVMAAEISRLLDKYAVKFAPALATTPPDRLRDGDVLASSRIFTIRYGDLSGAFSRFGATSNDLLALVSQVVEVELFAAAAMEAGLDRDELFTRTVAEYEKSLAVNEYRRRFEERNAPSDGEIAEYIESNQYLANYPRTAKALMIVTKTKSEALDLRRRAMAGESFYELAVDRSIAPDARINAGRMGPVRIGGGAYTKIDRVLMSLAPGQVSEPVEGKHGYTIFKLLGVSELKQRGRDEVREAAVAALKRRKLADHLESLRSSARVEVMAPGP